MNHIFTRLYQLVSCLKWKRYRSNFFIRGKAFSFGPNNGLINFSSMDKIHKIFILLPKRSFIIERVILFRENIFLKPLLFDVFTFFHKGMVLWGYIFHNNRHLVFSELWILGLILRLVISCRNTVWLVNWLIRFTFVAYITRGWLRLHFLRSYWWKLRTQPLNYSFIWNLH